MTQAGDSQELLGPSRREITGSEPHPDGQVWQEVAAEAEGERAKVKFDYGRWDKFDTIALYHRSILYTRIARYLTTECTHQSRAPLRRIASDITIGTARTECLP